MHQKKIKHFYYWNKSLIDELDSDDYKKSKLVNLLKNK